METAELNNIKSTLSVTYIRAIAEKLNYAFDPSDRNTDGIGIDCSVINKGMGSTKPLSLAQEIKIQTKSFSRNSKSMYKESRDEIEYRVTSKIEPFGPAFYLVVFEFPEEEKFDEWLQITEKELILRKCAYYVHIKDTVNPGFIKIPRSNRLTDLTLPTLFINSDNKEKYI